MPRKKKTVYSGGSGKKKAYVPPADVTPVVRTNLVAIDVTAGAGRTDLKVGDTVRIVGSGLYSGEEVTVEKFSGTAIPAAVVRTQSGATRHVRTIDLEPIRRPD